MATRSILMIRRGGCVWFGTGVAMVGRYDPIQSTHQKLAQAGERIHLNCVGHSLRKVLRRDQSTGEVKYPAMSMMMFGQPALLMRLIAPSEPSFTITMFGMV